MSKLRALRDALATGLGGARPAAPADAPPWGEGRYAPENFVLDSMSFAAARSCEARHFNWLRFDSIYGCNIRCVYCRTFVRPPKKDFPRITPGDLEGFLRDNVLSLKSFQLGCAREPTIDTNMGRFLVAVRALADPGHLRVQTNGLLLERHDPEDFRRADVTFLSFSIDSVDPAVNAKLRGGASCERIVENLRRFRDACPEMKIAFVTVVTALNVDGAEEVVKAGLELGVETFSFREVAVSKTAPYWSSDEEKAALPLDPGRFAELERSLSPYAARTSLTFIPATTIAARGDQNRATTKALRTQLR